MREFALTKGEVLLELEFLRGEILLELDFLQSEVLRMDALFGSEVGPILEVEIEEKSDGYPRTCS